MEPVAGRHAVNDLLILQINLFCASQLLACAGAAAAQIGGSARGYPRAFVPLESRPTAGRAGG
jgi:hypothetical protein